MKTFRLMYEPLKLEHISIEAGKISIFCCDFWRIFLLCRSSEHVVYMNHGDPSRRMQCQSP